MVEILDYNEMAKKIAEMSIVLEETKELARKAQAQIKEVTFRLEKTEEEKLKEREARLEEKEARLEAEAKIEETEKKLNNLIFLNELFQERLPHLGFTKTVTSDTYHKSNHKAIKKEVTNLRCKILKEIYKHIDSKKLEAQQSYFLEICRDSKYDIQYADEGTIQEKVKLYLNDILRGSKLKLLVSKSGSVGVVSEDVDIDKNDVKRKYHTPDLWIILDDDYRPIIVIEVKSPNEDDEYMSDPNVLGQLYDYMLSLKSFYNQKHIFGILTSLDKWKFCWLPDTDEVAESDILFDNDIEEDVNPIHYNRELYTTKVYDHTHKNLTKLILSVIVKSYNSPKFPVKLLTKSRTYIRLTENNWRWIDYNPCKTKKKKCQHLDIDKLKNKITFFLPDNDLSTFTVLRYFHGGNYSKVRLAISDKGNMVVLKEFTDMSRSKMDLVTNQELECWHKINKMSDVYLTTICKKPTLVMPLVFHIHVKPPVKDENNKIKKRGRIYLPLDLKIWSVQDRAIPGDLPPILEKINQQLAEEEIDIIDIAEKAIKKCAKKKYVHANLELRHIAVYPDLDENNNLLRLIPMLIDFGIMKKVNSVQEAEDEMFARLDKLLTYYDENKYIIE